MQKEVLRICREDVRALFPPLPDRANKGMMGRVLCVCGSYDPQGASMCGAAYFAAMAAYRCGAGIVEIFTPSQNYTSLASNVPEAIFSLYGHDEEYGTVTRRLESSLKLADAVVIGCGLGQTKLSEELVRTVLSHSDIRVVVDADAINIIAKNGELWDCRSAESRKRVVLTPHPGEMSRLTGVNVGDILADTRGAAERLARSRGVVCVLKDHETVITDGATTWLNHSGNAGMASAGMGDVLSGILGALLARDAVDMSMCEAQVRAYSILLKAAVGVYLHGRAGDIAVGELGKYSLVASDVIGAISRAISENEV